MNGKSGFCCLYSFIFVSLQEAGASFVTIHPHTKRQKYEGRASWSLIAQARQLLQIPVVS
jgi:tRNA-dihydrouridine synthase C